ncbi:MAG: cell division protein FtsZ [Ignavibacteriales bacterium]|nr:cell division protein FtsZ [Ignavibacteriales bacterium]
MLKFVTLDREEPKRLSAQLKVVGVGGGGCNAIDSMINRGLRGVEFVAVNTDAQVLDESVANQKIQIGTAVTRGLGAGADPNVGKKAAEEDREKISRVLDGSDMVFVTAGMGGGTGTGAAPIVASVAKSLGALVIGIVTKPFSWEGKQRMKNADDGIKELKQYVDSLIVIPNSRILSIIDTATAARAAFDKPNEILYEATRGIADIITIKGIINVDFADVRTVMRDSGHALMGCGISSGENRAVEAAQKAISSPLLEGVSIKGAKNILLNVSGAHNMTMQEIEAGNQIIFEAAGEEANVIFGVVNKDEMSEYISYTVIATGFASDAKMNSISSIKKEKEEKAKEKKNISVGAFSKSKMEIDQSADLSIPTILRVKGKDPELFGDDSIIRSGYKSESNTFDDEEELPRRNYDEEDSSSFLRKIMD